MSILPRLSTPTNNIRPRRVNPARSDDAETFQSLDEYAQRNYVNADPATPERRADLPPPYLGAPSFEQPDAPPLSLPDAASPPKPGDNELVDVEPSSPAANYAVGSPILPRPTPSTASPVPQSNLEREQQEYNQLSADEHPKYHGGRFGAGLHNFLYNLSRNAEAVSQAAIQSGRPVDEYGLATVIGGGAGGFASGAVNPNLIAERKREQRMSKLQQDIKTQVQTEREQAQLEQVRAQTGWITARPGIEARKVDAQGAKRAQEMIQREIGNRLKEPRPFDPSDSYDSDLAARAEAAGVRFARGSFGDFKNPATMEIVDPSDPSGTRKTRLSYNRESGEFQPVTVDGKEVQAGYVQPVGADGLTEAARRGDADRDASRVNLERQRSVSNELARAGLGIAQGHLALAGQSLDLRKLELDQRFSEQTRSELKDANKLLSEANGAQAEADDYSGKGWYTGDDGLQHRAKFYLEKETTAANKAEALRQQFYGSYGYLWGNKMTRLQFSKNHPELMDSSEGSKFHSNKEIDEMARRYNIEIVPDDSPIDTSPSVGNSLPRRPAPSRLTSAPAAAAPAPAAGKTHVSRTKFRGKYPDFKDKSDAEVDSAIRSSGYEPIP